MKKVIISLKNSSKTNNGIFEGWGTSLCWWANRIGHSEKLTSLSSRLFFSEEGLDLNIMRYNIGGGDNPSHNHITRTDSEMPGWWTYDKQTKSHIFNNKSDIKQINVLRSAYKAAGNEAYVEAFSNSPPYYMTVSGCSSGSFNAVSDNIKASSIKEFAEYLSYVCQSIENDYKIKIKSLAPLNEPFSNYWKENSEKQEGCFVSPGKMQSDVIVFAKEALNKAGLNDITVTASDETNTVTQYISAKMLSEQALNSIGRLSTHTYAKATSHIGEFAREKKLNLWMSETDWSGVSGENAGEMGPALWLAEKIIEDMNTLSPSAWVIWQIVASYISKFPDSKGRFDMQNLPDLTKGFWGTAFADIDNEEIYLTQKYYAFGQFTKFIRPGMTIINTDNNQVLSAIDKKNKKIVIVTVNTQECSQELLLDFPDISVKDKILKAVRTGGSTENGEHWKELPEHIIENNQLSVSLPKHSITTFIIH